MTYVSPCCGAPTIPPAVNPGSSRFCRKCGAYYAPHNAREAVEQKP